jgi:hypothetical protein
LALDFRSRELFSRKIMSSRNDITKILIAAIGLAVAMRSVSWGHPTSAPEIPYVPVVKCQTVQLQSEDGKPIARVPVHLKVMQTKMMKGNSVGIGAVVTFKVLKKLKTDAAGKIQFPEVEPDSYFLVLPKTKEFTRPFGFRVDSKPGNCSQTFVLQDKGFMDEIAPAAPKTVDNK